MSGCPGTNARRRRLAAAAVAAALIVGLAPTVVSAAAAIAPGDVLASPVGSCFAGSAKDTTCGVATSYANDWVLAGDGQDAQIRATGRISTNESCAGSYYLSRTIVSSLDKTTFEKTFAPSRDGVGACAQAPGKGRPR